MRKIVISIPIAFLIILSCTKNDSVIDSLNSSKKQNDELKIGLIAFYPFNGDAKDMSANSLHGSVNGATLTKDRNGESNQAYQFADNQDISIPKTQNLNTYPITISLWYNTSRLLDGEASNLFSKYSPALWDGFQILLSDCRKVENQNSTFNHGFGVPAWYIKNNTNRVLGYYNEEAFLQKFLSKDTWYHYVFVVDKSGGKIYVNGILIDSHAWTGTDGSSSNNNLWKIGGQYITWFNGKIDDVGIWNRALTEKEINFLSTNTPKF